MQKPTSAPARPARGATTVQLPPDERALRVSGALRMPPGGGAVEVYVGWEQEPVRVETRLRAGAGLDWLTACPLLRARVATAIRPLEAAGWRMDGTLVSAMRWDTSHVGNGQQYDGCWVRMRPRDV